MNAYLFTSVATLSQLRPNMGRYGASETIQIWDNFSSLVVVSNNQDTAREQFEAWLHTQPEGENPVTVQIKKIASAQFVDQLLTESGNAPLDWPEIWKQWQTQAESLPVDDFEQGYWVDVESVVRPGQPGFDVETFRRGLPEDIRTGLNWSPDKQFFFILSVLAPLAPPPEIVEEPEEDVPNLAESPDDENAEKPDPIEIGELYNMFPGALDKAGVAMIKARNSAVAAWLWRKYAATARLAANQIRIDPLCGVMGIKTE
ncbi:MAG TPA: hypothetical protein VFV23_05760 [Verrucomicrobiae bacterium]|nr:hypothetical protein [Verrucomicrobiae bacterium]